MEKIDAQVEILAQCIRDSQTYCNYRVQVEKIEKQTGLLEQINEFRRKNFELQSVEPSLFLTFFRQNWIYAVSCREYRCSSRRRLILYHRNSHQ